ncbi:MAG: MATE family efflux transporter [Selenomonadaceae bacterium]|nr:MATE family efflux transporter [Selenomonadaceae bacterium]
MREDFFSTIGEIIKYGGSTFAALVATSIYTTTDGFFIGNWVGTDGLEALALVYPVTMIFIALGTLFETGGSAIVSQIIGEGKKALAEKVMRSNYFFAFVVGIIAAVVGNIFVGSVLQTFVSNSDEQHIVDMAVSFLRISLCGLPFLLIIYLTGAFMRCVEKPAHVFYLVGSTSLANIILDALFIIGFGWEMQGAAVATVLAQIIGTAISFWYFRYSRQKFVTSWSLSSLEYIWQEVKVGAGFAVATLMMCFIEYFLNATLLRYDAAHLLASATIANIILTFIYLPLNGLDTGIQPLVSKLFAARKEQHYLRVMRYSFFATMILTFAIYVALMIFTEELARFFVDDADPVTAEMITFLRMMFILQPFVGIYTWLSGIMAALEDEWRNFVISLLPLVVLVPLIWFLPQVLPIEFVSLAYSAQDVAEAAVAFLLIRSFLSSKKLSLKKILLERS